MSAGVPEVVLPRLSTIVVRMSGSPRSPKKAPFGPATVSLIYSSGTPIHASGTHFHSSGTQMYASGTRFLSSGTHIHADTSSGTCQQTSGGHQALSIDAHHSS